MSNAKGGAGIRHTQGRAVPSKRRRLPKAHDTDAGLGTRHKTEATRPTGATPICRVIHADVRQVGKQGLTYFPGVSAESVGSQGI